MGNKLAIRRKKKKQDRQAQRPDDDFSETETYEDIRNEPENPDHFYENIDSWSAYRRSSLRRDSTFMGHGKNGQEKRYDPRDPTLTFVDEEDVLDYLFVGFGSLKATMSCGHAVTPMSLTQHCRRLLDEGKYKFVCGQTDCNVEWHFEEVCKMALLTDEEIEEFEHKMFTNAAKGYLDVKQCPGCKSRVVRNDLYNLNVECSVCTAQKRRVYRFCWQCLREWKGRAPRSDRCDNDGCPDPLDILRNCPVIDFTDVKGVNGCPSIRACPTCGCLVEHNETQCKSMVCPRCRVKFCFVCLSLTKDCLRIDPYSLCSAGVAPRQTSIPVWQRI